MRKLFIGCQMIYTTLLITTYNWEAALNLVLRSVVWQSQLPHEVIVADDGSNKSTLDVIETHQQQFPIPLHHVWHQHLGFRAGTIRNKAIAQATGQYVICVDGDMILHPEFIHDHLKVASDACFVQGSRVLTSRSKTQKLLNRANHGNHASTAFTPKWCEQGLTNRKNAVRLPILTKLLSFAKRSQSLNSIRTCNFAAWRHDLINVNGFNEDIEGWGREDSELVARLYNKGIKRKNLRFSGIGYHLHHEQNSRHNLVRNDAILQNTIRNQTAFCENGINKHLENAIAPFAAPLSENIQHSNPIA